MLRANATLREEIPAAYKDVGEVLVWWKKLVWHVE